MKTKTIKQTVTFPLAPVELYNLLFDSKKLTKMHGNTTSMTRRAKGKFSVFGGYCHGHNITLIENRKIEQAWHFNEEGWPEDYYSTCTFILDPALKGTKLTFIQSGVPEASYKAIKEGWKTYYWTPILEYLEG
jgi:activator of HSP90 ATPase